ncbi:hypothetical protein MRX96_026036 [Rhipicephalus microplus]
MHTRMSTHVVGWLVPLLVTSFDGWRKGFADTGDGFERTTNARNTAAVSARKGERRQTNVTFHGTCRNRRRGNWRNSCSARDANRRRRRAGSITAAQRTSKACLHKRSRRSAAAYRGN